MDTPDLKPFYDRYTPTEAEALKNKIRMARFNHVITDPFPEITEAQMYNETVREARRTSFFCMAKEIPVPQISAHAAFRQGQLDVWNRIWELTK
jgi:hypothetical protein